MSAAECVRPLAAPAAQGVRAAARDPGGAAFRVRDVPAVADFRVEVFPVGADFRAAGADQVAAGFPAVEVFPVEVDSRAAADRAVVDFPVAGDFRVVVADRGVEAVAQGGRPRTRSVVLATSSMCPV